MKTTLIARATTGPKNSSVYVDVCDLGRGVFAAEAFAPGKSILEFTGQRIDLAQALGKGVLHCNPLQVDEERYIDLEAPGVFVNHSCQPNAGIIDDVILVALRTITRGEEIRFDYSTTMSDGTWELPCKCLMPSCRGVVRDFDYLMSNLQQHYLSRGIVQRFIAKRYGFGGLG